MKDKRNCNNQSYPVYTQPMIVPPMGYPINYQYPPNLQNIQDQQLNNIEQQINILDQRITRLEKANNNSNSYNKYNDSNYYMV